MNMNLPIKPVCTQDLELDEVNSLINLPLWTRFEAACYLSGKVLLNFEEFQSSPPRYQERLNELLKDPSTDPDLLQEFQKFKTKYPDIEEMYDTLGKLSKPRIANIQTDFKTGIMAREGDCLQNLSRYEANIEKNFYRALYQLKELQKARKEDSLNPFVNGFVSQNESLMLEE